MPNRPSPFVSAMRPPIAPVRSSRITTSCARPSPTVACLARAGSRKPLVRATLMWYEPLGRPAKVNAPLSSVSSSLWTYGFVPALGGAAGGLASLTCARLTGAPLSLANTRPVMRAEPVGCGSGRCGALCASAGLAIATTLSDRSASKGPGRNKVVSLGAEAPARQGARSAHTGRM